MIQSGLVGAILGGWPGLSVPTSTMRLLVATVLLAFCLWLLMPNGYALPRWRRVLAALSGGAGLAWLWTLVPDLGSTSTTAAFWIFSGLTLAAALATISAHSPVYSAIWFAASLLGTAALFLLQGAQFVSIATVAVYAGAIVVTFLFVLMLAQPAGHTFYDRISWGVTPRLVGALAAASFAVLLVASLPLPESRRDELQSQRELSQQVQQALTALQGDEVELRSLQLWEEPSGRTRVRLVVAAPEESRMRLDQPIQPLVEAIARQRGETDLTRLTVSLDFDDVRTSQHMATLGGRLFGRHLIAIEVAGTLLLVALVGAIAMISRDAAVAESPRGI